MKKFLLILLFLPILSFSQGHYIRGTGSATEFPPSPSEGKFIYIAPDFYEFIRGGWYKIVVDSMYNVDSLVANKLRVARNINGVPFNGTQDITITAAAVVDTSAGHIATQTMLALKQNIIANLADTSKYYEAGDNPTFGIINATGLTTIASKPNLHLGANNRFYKSTDTSGGGSTPTGVLADQQFSILQADGTLSAASGVQVWAGSNGSAQDIFTVAANSTYRFEGMYYINTGATTHTTAMAFALTTATVASFEYQVMLWNAAANAISTTQSTTHVTGVASKVVNATSTAVYTIIQFQGTFVTGTGGTITPQINFSANPTGTNLMKRGSFICIQLLGTNTVTKSGGWN